MPVTGKLPRECYERFGDKIADEMVSWFNEADAAHRADLKELLGAWGILLAAVIRLWFR